MKEFYRVRYTADRMYLLDYERTMNQMFDETEDIFANNKIYLGIMGDEVSLEESDGGNVIAFVTGNRLYSYNIADQKLAFLFWFFIIMIILMRERFMTSTGSGFSAWTREETLPFLYTAT